MQKTQEEVGEQDTRTRMEHHVDQVESKWTQAEYCVVQSVGESRSCVNCVLENVALSKEIVVIMYDL